MYKNYFFLNRFVVEANQILKGFTVEDIFTQEKNILIIHLTKEEVNKFLKISVNPGTPYITIVDDYRRAKKNSIDIFPSIISENVELFEIAESDRVIRLKLHSSMLFFAIRGKHTNIVVINNRDEIEAFKKDEDYFLKEYYLELKQLKFKPNYSIPEMEKFIDELFFKKIKSYPFIGREILKEIKFRTDKNYWDYVIEILKEILNEDPALFINEDEVNLAVKTFHIFPYKEVEEYSNLIDAINSYITKKFYIEIVLIKKSIIQKKLDHELKKITERLNNLKSRLEKKSKEEEYNKIGNLLLINIDKIKKGMNEIELQNIYNEEKPEAVCKIKLKDNLSPQKNADYYFDKSKSEKISYLKSKEIYSKSLKEFEKLTHIEEKFDRAETLKDYISIMDELHIKDKNQDFDKHDLQSKFKEYLIDSKYRLFVGRDSKNNDLLTTKFARQNDFWFHARGVSGSHAVLKVENTKEAVPKNVLKKAASIAAFHSKAKTASTAPVSFTLKKYVVKKKGMEPGKVALLREDTLLVKPEIPAGCEYVEK